MTPSEIADSLLLPYLEHARRMFESGYATAEDIDNAMRFGCGYPAGPLATAADRGLFTPPPVAGEERTEPRLHQEISRVGVVGTGTMATGIVQVFASSGYDVVYVGRTQDKVLGVRAAIERSLDRLVEKGRLDADGRSSVLDRLIESTEREALADVDIVIEAIAEDLAVKTELYRDLDRIARNPLTGRGAILATTTSSMPITRLAEVTSRPGDVIGMHFFNPAPVMKLVEIVTTELTSPEVDETVKALTAQVGKVGVSCGDRAGFIVNCLLFPYLNDAVRLLESGAASMTEIDDAVKAELGFPMGPFELLDVVGNDVSLAIEQELFNEFGEPAFAPAKLLEQKVAAGELGRKTRIGFHAY
ncbi:3-hydroxyacyl-CoA dehydrogenase NAD-binding domain-containing protein [Nocardioides sp.]|uniref:3-hydroxyacyl-CoA dehydrogenase family protein n=1 Tax=Nocardioides sp. TaxID=35761 RepID=UPI0039E6E572